jgi:hypothetical protein
MSQCVYDFSVPVNRCSDLSAAANVFLAETSLLYDADRLAVGLARKEQQGKVKAATEAVVEVLSALARCQAVDNCVSCRPYHQLYYHRVEERLRAQPLPSRRWLPRES